MFYALIIGNLVMAAAFALSHTTIPPQIPLFYSRTAGEDQLAEWWMLFALPFFMNFFVVVNAWIAGRFKNNEFVGSVVTRANYVLIIGFTIVFIKIILLVS